MTAKRDLKRRIRERQAKTGESYVTARRHVLAQRDDAVDVDDDVGDADERSDATGPSATVTDRPPTTAAPAASIAVVELVDITDSAADHGVRCSVRISPALVALVEPAIVLARLHDVLASLRDDESAAASCELVLDGKRPSRGRVRDVDARRQLLQRAKAGLGGTSRDGTLAFAVEGSGRLVMVVCSPWRNQPAIVLSTVDDGELGGHIVPPAPMLYVVFDGNRQPVTRTPFVIGRTQACDLRIRDGLVSREHAAIVRRDGVFYVKDLGSTHGLVYRGLRIDNKRIDEGDAVVVAGYELRFTFRASD